MTLPKTDEHEELDVFVGKIDPNPIVIGPWLNVASLLGSVGIAGSVMVGSAAKTLTEAAAIWVLDPEAGGGEVMEAEAEERIEEQSASASFKTAGEVSISVI